MASFKRSLFGYRRPEVDAAISARDGADRRPRAEPRRAERASASPSSRPRPPSLSGMVIEREREIRVLDARLHEANECHDRSIASLDAVTARLEEMEAQARGQATRIRMKALREAVEVSRRVQALTEASEAPARPRRGADGAGARQRRGAAPIDFDGLYEGRVKLEIGPLGDFSQLVGFEDAVGELGASEISVERFSEGRATLSMHLDEPVDLLRELEELSAARLQGPPHRPGQPRSSTSTTDQGPEQHAA